MIAITFALPTESAGLRRHLRNARKDRNMVAGKIGDHVVTILHTGVGAENCNERMETLLHTARPRLVIGSGFAGAVTDDLEVSDLILAENFSDPGFLERAQQILSKRGSRRVKLFTSTSIVDSVAERNQIARASGAVAVDMETGAIAGVCNGHGVPLLSLRAISDTPRQPFPMPPNVLFDIERQRPNYSRLIFYLFRYPSSIGPLLRFDQQIAHVRAILTDAIVALVKEI